jgi:hypothetical protein
VFVTEKRLSRPVFQSAALISVANFNIPNKIEKRSIKLGEFMSSYHESIIEIDSNYDRDLTRYIVFTYYLEIKNMLLDGSELSGITKSAVREDIDKMIKEVIKHVFSKKYVYIEIHNYIKTLKDAIETERPNNHLIHYKDTYEELIYGNPIKAKAV